MTLRDVARYLRPGTSLVLVVSVLIIPLWIWVATAHADHWFGGQRENIWSMTVRPWGGRLWSLTVVISISGWAAWYESMPPRKLTPMVDRLVAAILVLLLAAAVAAPTWRWLAEVGALSGGDVFGTACLACLPPLAAVISASLSRTWLQPNLSLPIGIGLGLACLSILWGPM